jgi:hypothetical protein
MDIKTRLEYWTREADYETPEDPLLEVEHSINTAEAYRWATLLYLHQAVPELPSLTAHELAEKVITLLKTIPSKSRSCIVHIYPLLAAGCEAVGKDERDWVNNRWQDMCDRMWIGNVDKAWEVVKAVWDRRDRFELEQQIQKVSPSMLNPKRRLKTKEVGAGEFYVWDPSAIGGNGGIDPKHLTTDSKPKRQWLRCVTKCSPEGLVKEFEEGEMEYEVTVRGKLHWVSVMKDNNWEVLLG